MVNKCKITLYADDTALFFSSKRVPEIQTVLISELKHINNWFKNNKLTLNVSKTKYTIIGTSQSLKSKSPNLTLSIDNNILEHVTCYKYLGGLPSSWAIRSLGCMEAKLRFAKEARHEGVELTAEEERLLEEDTLRQSGR